MHTYIHAYRKKENTYTYTHTHIHTQRHTQTQTHTHTHTHTHTYTDSLTYSYTYTDVCQSDLDAIISLHTGSEAIEAEPQNHQHLLWEGELTVTDSVLGRLFACLGPGLWFHRL